MFDLLILDDIPHVAMDQARTDDRGGDQPAVTARDALRDARLELVLRNAIKR